MTSEGNIHEQRGESDNRRHANATARREFEKEGGMAYGVLILYGQQQERSGEGKEPGFATNI